MGMNTLEHLFPVSFGKGWVGRGLVLLKVFYFPFPNTDIMGGGGNTHMLIRQVIWEEMNGRRMRNRKEIFLRRTESDWSFRRSSIQGRLWRE